MNRLLRYVLWAYRPLSRRGALLDGPGRPMPRLTARTAAARTDILRAEKHAGTTHVKSTFGATR